MERKWILRIVLLVVLLGISAMASLTTVIQAPKSEQNDPVKWLRNLFPGINLGLDLQGGLRLIYEVGVDDAVENKRDNLAQSLVGEITEKAKIKGVIAKPSREEIDRFDLVFEKDGQSRSAEVRDIVRTYRTVLNEAGESRNILHLELKPEIVEETKELAIRQAVETIGNRIDIMGLSNTSVVPRMANEDIIVQIPGIDDAQISRIKRIIAQTARLELKIVDDEGSVQFFSTGVMRERLEELASKDDRAQNVKLLREPGTNHHYLEAKNEVRGRSGRLILEEFFSDVELPNGREISFQEEQARDMAGNPTADVVWRTYFTHRIAGITGEYIDQAGVQFGEQGRPYVSLTFNQEGSNIFADLTGENVNERMAIILDGKVQSAPVIQERISGGTARITLGRAESFDRLMSEARDLVVVLNAGALPAPIRPVTESTIGPQLGEDAIAMGQLAFIISIVAILFFMIIYYRSAGFAADIALVCNGIFIMAILGGLGATLTLPGIAGIILTVGMAVDANVIIYERIREELRGGKSSRAAVDAGYKRAFWTIFDAQITTFIAGVVMLQYGTGAIKGFAVTLLVGIVTSMFSAIFISRLVFDFMTRNRAKQLSI